MKKRVFLGAALALLLFGATACSDETHSGPKYDIYIKACEKGYLGSYEEWLNNLDGIPDSDGREIELDIIDNNICFRYKGEDKWNILKSLDELIESSKPSESASPSESTNPTDVATEPDNDSRPDSKPDKTTTPSTTGPLSDYEKYLQEHPEYKKTEEQWLKDILNGRLDGSGYNFTERNLNIDFDPALEMKRKKISTYFFKDGSVPYLGIDSYFKAFEDFFLTSMLHKSVDKNIVTYSYYINKTDYEMKIDYLNDTIYLSDVNYFGYLNGDERLGQKTDYLKVVDYEYDKDNSITFDLAKYDIDIINYDNDILIQTDVLSNLTIGFTSYGNLGFNGSNFFFYFGGSDPYNSFLLKEMKSSKNGTKRSPDFKKAWYNGMIFLLDHFYGLKGYKNIDSFYTYIDSIPGLKSLFMSDKIDELNRGYARLFHKELDDLHTSLVLKPIYNKGDFTFNFDEYEMGSNTLDYYDRLDFLEYKYQAEVGEVRDLYIEGNTAFIKFNEFTTGEVLDNRGHIIPDADRYDTFAFVQFKLKYLRDYNKTASVKVNNVVLDITTNSGGDIEPMFAITGLFTNDDIKLYEGASYNNNNYITTIKVDADLDGDFNDLDAFTEFKLNILQSDISFSSGHCLPVIAKDNGAATLLGGTTRGGMCDVCHIVFLDCTTTFTNGFTSARHPYKNSNDNFDYTEGGQPADYKLKDSRLYDFKYLNSFINNNYK